MNNQSEEPAKLPTMVNTNEVIPLLNTTSNNKPAKLETMDETINGSKYPGIDDGFFASSTDDDQSSVVPPTISTRLGEDDETVEAETTETETAEGNVVETKEVVKRPHFPPYGMDPEFGSMAPDLESIPDVNVYQHKKTLAQGMMDLALFSANANQLRYVMESYKRHPYYYPSIVFISLSLLLQVAIGCGLIWNATYNVKDKKEICIANKISNFTIIGIFLVTAINVFISAFGVANPDT